MKIAVVSGKGGSGKSSISASFIALSKHVTAIDCDVDCSNLPLLFEHKTFWKEKFLSGKHLEIDDEKCIKCKLCIENCVFKALCFHDDRIQYNPFLCEGCGFCSRICPCNALTLKNDADSDIYMSSIENGTLIHGRLKPGDDNSGKMIARLRDIADNEKSIKDTPLQILDGPPGIGCPVLSTITGVDKIVIVCEPTLSGLSDFKRCFDVCSSFCNDISAIINKNNLNTMISKEICNLCSSMDIPVIALLPFDRTMVEAQLNGKDIISYKPDSKCSAVLREAFHKLL